MLPLLLFSHSLFFFQFLFAHYYFHFIARCINSVRTLSLGNLLATSAHFYNVFDHYFFQLILFDMVTILTHQCMPEVEGCRLQAHYRVNRCARPVGTLAQFFFLLLFYTEQKNNYNPQCLVGKKLTLYKKNMDLRS